MNTIRSVAARLVLFSGLLVPCAIGQIAFTDPPDSVPSRGSSATGQFSLSQIESVNAATGNVGLSIPLAHLPPGPGGFSAGVNLVYNSSLYDIVAAVPGTEEEYNYQTSTHGGGWSYGYRYTLWAQRRFPIDFNLTNACNAIGSTSQKAWFKNYLKTPDGGNHVLTLVSIIQGGTVTTPPPGSIASDPNDAYWQYDFGGNTSRSCGVSLAQFQGTLVFATVDSTYIRVEATTNNGSGTWTAYLPNGTQVTGPFSSFGGYAQDSDGSQVTDRNGNSLVLTGNCAPGSSCAETLKDGQNRTITIQFASNAGGTWTDEISWPGGNGLVTTAVDWTSLSPGGSINYYPLVKSDGSTDTTFSENLAANLSPAPSAVSSIEMPPGVAMGNFSRFTFGYSSWGEVHSVTLSSGTPSNWTQQYSATYAYCYDVGVSCPLATYPRPPATAINPLQQKLLQYYEVRDGANPFLITETTSYAILGPPNAFTYPQIGTVGQVTYPDNTYSEVFTANPCPSGFKSRDYCPALPYEILNRDGSVTRLGWASNTAPGGVPSSALFNPYVQYSTYTASGFSVSNGSHAVLDPNGNATASNAYDWMAMSNVSVNTAGFITGISGSATRTTTVAYYEHDQGQSAYYWNHGAPTNLRATENISIGSPTCSQSNTCIAVAQYSYDNALTTANVLQIQQSDPIHSTNITNSWTYLSNGNVATATDPNSVVTQLTYDGNNLYPTAMVAAQGKPEHRTLNYTFDFSSGLKASETDVDNNNKLTSFSYDNLGRIIEATESVASLGRATNTSYDDVNLTVTTTSDDVTSQRVSSTRYSDPLGRVRLVVDGAGDKIQRAYRYDNVAHVSYELQSNPYGVAATDSMTQGWTVVTRDPLGRVTSSQHFQGANPPIPWGSSNPPVTGQVTTAYNQTSSSCSGPATKTTDEAGHTQVYCQDGLGRLLNVTDPLGTTTSYGYDLLDNLVTVDMPGQATMSCPGEGTHTRCFSYTLSRLLTATNPESGTTTYTYDNSGNPLSRSDANGTVMAAVANPQTNAKYDGLNRPYGFSYTLPNPNLYNVAASPAITYTYDQGFKGALSGVANGTSATVYCHDGFGRIASSAQATPSVTLQCPVANGTQSIAGTSPFTFQYTYSLTDQLTSITYPSGRQVGYGLDAADRVQTVQNVATSGNYATIGYTAPSDVATMTLGNSVSHQLSWNDRLQVIGMAASKSQTSLLSLGFYPCSGTGVTSCSSGNTGNLQSQSINIPAINGAPSLNVTQAYAYDSLNRLTQASENGSAAWTQNYSYDASGNRAVTSNPGLPSLTPETPQTSSWYTSSNRISNIGANPPWSYDANGNLLQVGGMNRSFTYDAENRQVAATINGAVATYSYDGNGLRVSRTVNGQTTVYVYDAFGNLTAEYGPGAASPCDTTTCYLTTDHLGSTRMLTDSSGSTNLNRYDYQPFGQEILAGTNGRQTAMGYFGSADNLDPKFTGQYRDPETAIDWFNVRHMSGAQGRFQSPDPANAGANLADPQTWNAYAYVGNNPLTYTDPSGMFVAVPPVDPTTIGIDVGLGLAALFGGIFGGGGYSGPSVPNWAGTAWVVGPAEGPVLQPSPSADWEQMPARTTPGDGSDLSGSWDEGVPIRGSGGLLNAGGVFGGGSLASILGIQMPSPWVLSVNPNVQVQSWYSRLLEHLQKIELNPNSQSVPHWRAEVRNFARQIMSKGEQVTKGRRTDALEKYLQRTLGISADELSKYLRTPIMFIDTCKLDPYQPVCLGRSSSVPIY